MTVWVPVDVGSFLFLYVLRLPNSPVLFVATTRLVETAGRWEVSVIVVLVTCSQRLVLPPSFKYR